MRQMNEKDTAYVGIDPGKTSGAMAVIHPGGRVELALHTGPLCYRGAIEALAARGPLVVAVERLFARPGRMSSAKANFELGRCCGELETMLAMLGVGFQGVTPQRWQREFGVSGDKEAHVAIARQLFPGVDLRRSEKCRKDFDGFADALLIAEFARRRIA